ncbi:hypothetical protein JG688_00002434 [Phytophthora aleatoria]|uniref:Uncharacterized protein n=1 Tax=Phytophthora aleatoria TaxID=2496075 RepID=A0A8J5J5P0_9STRA|nr:hypothetical protein JG688_00002434 [Phytophthora aleatoria]
MPHLNLTDIPKACEGLVRAAVELANKERNTPFPSAPSLQHRTHFLLRFYFESFNISDYMFGGSSPFSSFVNRSLNRANMILQHSFIMNSVSSA